MSLKSFTSAAVATSVVVFSLFAVSAQADDAAVSVAVPLEKFDLSKQNDASQLYSRLQRTARAVCSPLESRDLSAKQRHQDCYNTALANAVADVNDVRLTSLHQSDNSMRIASQTSRPRS